LSACAVADTLFGCKPAAWSLASRPAHVVDLSHTLSPAFPFIPIQNKTFPFRITPIATLAKDGVYANRWELTEHVGTHLDAPCHFAPGGAAVDEIPVASLIAPLAVLNIAARASNDPDASLELEDLLTWERRNGRLPERAALFMNSGWGARAQDARRFVNLDADGTLHFPGFSERLIEFLVSRRAISGVGVDSLSIDPGPYASYPAHKRLFAAGKWAVECLANLDRVPARGATVIVSPVKVKGASGAPARVLAVW